MDFQSVFNNYENFREPAISDRFFKHLVVEELLNKLPSDFRVETKGYSEEGRSINLVTWGQGEQKVFLWSQMHGNEATGTMALFDLTNFLSNDAYQEITAAVKENCTLYLLPMVNPDGAQRFIRRNAKQIDINRDFRDTITPEARLLRSLREEISPDFGFNLHDQDTLWSVEGSQKSATLSYLAPSYDQSQSINETRTRAMQIIAEVFEVINAILPGRTGLFPDAFESRAFGDNFQLAGTSTILLEAGGYKEDHEKQEVRKYFFLSILTGLMSIANGFFQRKSIIDYQSIPNNDKQIFHVILHDIAVNGLKTSIGLNYVEVYFSETNSSIKYYYVTDIGDLHDSNAYKKYSGSLLNINEFLKVDSLANFKLLQDEKLILSFTDGILA
jgi:hypothetical protein